MNREDLLHLRLANQQLIQPQFCKAEELLPWMCAMQAQDYAHALWAIGMRLPSATEASVEQALDDRRIVRSWIMRGTFHICHAGDLYWLLDLVGPRVITQKKSRYRQLELDQDTLQKAIRVLEKTLEGGKALERKEIGEALKQAGIIPKGQRLYHILHHAALEKVICLGKRRGKALTYTLLTEYLPAPPPMDRQQSLYEIAKRFFLSRGPASLKDFAWWAGLPMKDAKAALEMAKSELIEYIFEGERLWGNPEGEISSGEIPTILLPAFDEYVIPYQQKGIILQDGQDVRIISNNGMFFSLILENGKLAGTWKRSLRQESVTIELRPLSEIGKIAEAVQAYGRFLGKAVELQ